MFLSNNTNNITAIPRFKLWWMLLLLALLAQVRTVQLIRIHRYFNYDDESHHYRPQQHRPLPSSGNIEHIEAFYGTNLKLYCPIILEQNDEIYSLKWYRKFNGTYYEFFSYISSPNQTIHHTALPGVRLDLDSEVENDDDDDGNVEDGQDKELRKKKRNGEMIHLIQINLDTGGIYRCEVISDETFQIDRKEFNLTILVPMVPPKILYEKKFFSLGEQVHLKCLSGIGDANKDAAAAIAGAGGRTTKTYLKWYINNNLVGPETTNWTTIFDTYDQQHQTTSSINHPYDNNDNNTLVIRKNKLKQDRLSPSSTTTSLKSLNYTTESILNQQRNQQPNHHHHPHHFVSGRISLLNFQLTPQHVNSRAGIQNHFSVRCHSSLIQTKLYPPYSPPNLIQKQQQQQQHQQKPHAEVAENQPAAINLSKASYDDGDDAKNHQQLYQWQSSPPTPIIQGLKDEYQIGERVNVRCVLLTSGSSKTNFDNLHERRIEWRINERKIHPSKIKMDQNGEQSILCFKLDKNHLDSSGSFSLKCTVKQKYSPSLSFPSKKEDGKIKTGNGNNRTTKKVLDKINLANNNNLNLKNDTWWWPKTKSDQIFKSFGAALIPIAVLIVVITIG